MIDIILGDLAAQEAVRFKPTLLVGAPGCGKSSLARSIADRLGLPVELASLAGSADSSMLGTSAQWSTVRESTPLQLVKRSRKASVPMIDKSASGKHTGSVLDALLPLLERDQSRRYRDLALEVEVDLSAVSHFATANDIDKISAPLKDRFRILHMPKPGWQHIGVLSCQIIDKLAAERGAHRGFYPGMAADELHLVRMAWLGGSVRQLTRVVMTMVDGRDCILPRC